MSNTERVEAALRAEPMTTRELAYLIGVTVNQAAAYISKINKREPGLIRAKAWEGQQRRTTHFGVCSTLMVAVWVADGRKGVPRPTRKSNAERCKEQRRKRSIVVPQNAVSSIFNYARSLTP